MNLSRTRAILQAFEAQIAALDLDDFMRNSLAQYLAVIFYSEMEERIADLIGHQLQKYTNTLIGRYLAANMDKIIRRTPKSDIVDLLANFGEQFKLAFNDLISDRDVSIYSNVIAARHGVGHRKGSNVTLLEIKDGIKSAE
jgi:hypothetical protein